MYKEGYNKKEKRFEEADHNNWERAEDSTASFQVLKKEILPDWFRNKGAAPRDSTLMNSNAIKWMRQYKVKDQWYLRNRNPIPPFVVWNLASRPPPLDPKTRQKGTVWEQKRFFYWIYLRKPDSTTFDPTAIIQASYSKSDRSIQIDQPNDYIALLLNDMMFLPDKLDKPINIYPGPKDGKTKATVITVERSEKIRQKTLEARGDKQLEFTAMIYFELKDGIWEVKTADTLDLVAPVKARL